MRSRTHMLTTCAVALSVAATAAGGSSCPGDINGDGATNVADVLAMLGDWGCVGSCAADVNDDGAVNVADILVLLGDYGCVADVGPVTTLSGAVTNLWTGAGIAGASVVVGEETIVTNASGGYSGELPVGLYDVVIDAENYTPHTQQIILFPNVPATLNAALQPVAPVIVNVIVLDDGAFGGLVDVAADVIVLDGSTIVSYAWTQTAGASAILTGAGTDLVTLTLGTRLAYKEQLFTVLAEPPIGPDELPPNVPLPPGEFPGGQQNRFEVVGVNPFALEEAGLVRLSLDVTTTSGVYSAEGEVDVALPWKPAGGIRNVPIDKAVLLHGKAQASYDWTLVPPQGSSAVLLDGATQYPEFTPDVPGLYHLAVTDMNAGDQVDLQVWAGNWRGIIEGQDADGRPVASSSCTGCHINLGQDKFTPWAQTGHAEIFTDLLNTNTHNSQNCFTCHAVGFDPGSDSNGLDDAFDYQDFLASGLINNPGDNWTTMLEEFPFSAQVANVQCESCHGPQWGLLGVGTGAHGPVQPEGEPRVSLSANVCAVCHGEPLRHGRFEQWQLSAHADYELALDEGLNGSCARCHTANGFLTWLPILLGDAPGDPTANIPITWTADEIHPQTCVTCHDPHAAGDTSGDNNTATVRISGNTPPLIAGFTAYGVGRGAICMTCHNSRNGLRNDSNFASHYGTTEATRGPHQSVQTDVLMGENAYNVQVGVRGNHSFLADTCAQCHMVQTPPPDQLSYNSNGTNHTFYAAQDVCANCHTGFDAPTIQAGVQDTLDLLQDAIEEAILARIAEQTSQGNIIDLDGDVLITDAADVLDVEFMEDRGRQAMTVTLTGGVFGPYSMNNVDILDASMVPLEAFYDSADPDLIKAGWNWALIHNDGGLGVHNPSYSYLVLGNAIQALDPAAAAAVQWPEWVQIPPGSQE